MTARAAFPARCGVAVVYGEHVVSQVYPASVPIETYIDNVIELLGDDLRRRGADVPDTEGCYEFHRANGSRLDAGRTLDELGVEDGTTLILAPVTNGEPFEPHYESLSTALARKGKELFPAVTQETAIHTALAIMTMAVATLLGLAVFVRTVDPSPAPAITAGAVGVLIAAGAYMVRRWWPDRVGLLSGFCWLSAASLAVSLSAAAPGPVGAAHLFIAALAFGVFSAATLILTGRTIVAGATVITLCVLGGLAAGTRMWLSVPAQRLGMVALVALLVLITAAPTIALRFARIRPPHFGSVTGRDLFARRDGMPNDAVAPVPEDPEPESDQDTTPRGPAIVAAARRANGVLTGICIAAAVALPPAVWATLAPGGRHGTAAAVLALLFVAIFISRGRAFTDRRQAVALVFGAAAAVCAAVARYVLHDPSHIVTAMCWSAAVLALLAASALVIAAVVPTTRFTPLVRMLAEWVELVAIVVALPLAAAVGGLFTWVRMR